MTKLQTFADDAHVVIAGANGGIGSALVDALLDDPGVARVTALSRQPVEKKHERLHPGIIDFADESSIRAAARDCGGDIDLVIVATGILHRGGSVQPEKAMREIAADSMGEVLAINTIGPALVAKHFLPVLRSGHKTVFAALSARVGSIGDNRLGGWVSYRASKAALNMTLRTLAIEHARRRPDSVVAGLHPGTVKTRLSGPFSSRVPDGKLFSPSQSVEFLIKVIDGLTAADSGGVFAWDGARIRD